MLFALVRVQSTHADKSSTNISLVQDEVKAGAGAGAGIECQLVSDTV